MTAPRLALAALCAAFASSGGAAAAGSVSEAMRDFDRILGSRQVGDAPLKAFLADLDTVGCLKDVQAELVPALNALRATYVTAREDGAEGSIERVIHRRLAAMSPDGELLVASWLDAPSRAKRALFCQDGLPDAWIDLSVDDYVNQAAAWFELSIREAVADQRTGRSTAQDAAGRLSVERSDLVGRFDATFPAGPDYDEQQRLLETRLSALWTRFVIPMLMEENRASAVAGRTVTLNKNPLAGSAPSQRLESDLGTPPPPPTVALTGADLPDPSSLRTVVQLHRRWMSRLALLEAEAKELGVDHDQLFAERSEEGAASRVIRGSQLESSLTQLLTDLDVLEAQVRRGDPDSPLLRTLLNSRAIPHTLGGISVLREDTSRCLNRLTVDVGREIDTHPLWLASAAAPEGLRLGEGAEPTWATALGGEGTPGRAYDGPLIPPSPLWSERTVQAIVRRHPELDEVDARILMGLIAAAFPDLGGPGEVELAVRSALLRPGGLMLSGQESTLSDLWKPGAPQSEQPVLVFKVRGR